MPKSKKPAPKGGKKAAAPKKVAKKPAKRKPSVLAPTNDRSGFEGMVGPAGSDAPIQKLTARQIDQFNADKMRADAFNKAQASKPLTGNLNQLDFAAPLHPTVEEQYLAAKDAYAHTLGLALHRAEQVRNQKPAKRGWFARFRSAVTGLFVSKKYAEANPDTTVREKA